MPIQKSLSSEIKSLLLEARKQVVRSVNTTMVQTYFKIGKIIVEHEQKGKERAEYGKETLKLLSKELTKDFGRGFSVTNLKQMKSFYIVYSKGQTLSDQFEKSSTVLTISKKEFQLSWSHYVFLLPLKEREKNFYEKESIINNWSLRELRRQFDSALFERIAFSTSKKGVKEKSLEKYHSPAKPEDVIKDPYILEFLGLREEHEYTESELEQAIIDKLEEFLLELGKGFTFVGRQQRFTFDEQHFFVDLVFYNRLLKCFVVVDLKIGKIKHQDVGQMQMYVNFYNRYVKTEEENPTIGILLSRDKNKALVEITLPEKNNIFSSEYNSYLPTKEELKREIEGV